MNIIDLAGSEKNTIDYKGKTSEELEKQKKIQIEASFINKSLTTLSRVISILADKNENKKSIPYRDSKLTMILQNSLNLKSRTAMIVTVSGQSNFYQTKDTIKFANCVMAVK